MCTNNVKKMRGKMCEKGVSLIELIVFIIVVGIASSALFATYNYSLMHNADPIIQVRALELAQARLDEVMALKYDENTPTGGIPACGSTGALACNNTTDSNANDVDDYNNVSDTPYSYIVKTKTPLGTEINTTYTYSRKVTVVTANNLKLITVTVSGPRDLFVTLSAFRANF